MKSVGELLPHPALHDLRALAKARYLRLLLHRWGVSCRYAPLEKNKWNLGSLRAFSQDKLVMVLFDKKTDEPVMFHMAFRAGYTHDVVIHLGLVMVVPAHQVRCCWPSRTIPEASVVSAEHPHRQTYDSSIFRHGRQLGSSHAHRGASRAALTE